MPLSTALICSSLFLISFLDCFNLTNFFNIWTLYIYTPIWWYTFSFEFVIRLKMPSDGTTTIDDIVQGKVTVKNEILDDMVILRSDNTPTYMLSSVVDDNDTPEKQSMSEVIKTQADNT